MSKYMEIIISQDIKRMLISNKLLLQQTPTKIYKTSQHDS